MSGPASIEGCPQIPARIHRLGIITERDPRRAVALARRWHLRAGDQPPADQAAANYCLGYALLRWERFDEALDLLNTAEAQYRALGDTRFTLHIQRALLYLKLLRGGAANQTTAWDTLATALTAHGDLRAALRAQLGHMILLNFRGLTTESLHLAEQIAPQLAQFGTPGDKAWLLRIRAFASIGRGDFPAAHQDLQAAAEAFAVIKQQIEQAKTRLEHSMLYERSGDLVAALDAVERAALIFERVDLPLRRAACQKNRGILLALLGAYDRGMYHLLQAYTSLSTLGNRALAAGCELNLGNIAYYAGLGELALAAYQRAEAVYGDLDQQGMRLLCRRNQALALQVSGKLDAALQLLDELETTATQLDHQTELAEIALARGQILADLERVTNAIAQLSDAEKQFRALGNLASAGECVLDRARLILQQGDVATAESGFREAEQLLHNQPIFRWRITYGLGRCAELRGDPSAAFDHYRAAALTVAQLRRRLASEHASSGVFTQARALVEDAIRLAWQLERFEQLLELDDVQRALALIARLRAEQVQAIKDIAHDEHLASRHTSVSPADDQRRNLQLALERRLRRHTTRPPLEADNYVEFDLHQLRTALEQNFGTEWTLLVYVSLGEQLLIVMVDPAQLAVVAIAYDQALQRLLKRLTSPQYRMLSYLSPGTDDEPYAAAQPMLSALADLLIPTQVRQRLHPAHRLLIVPSGPLHSLPWAALRPDGAWLVEQAVPQLLPGLQIWQALQTRPMSGSSALAIGVSRFGDRAAELNGVRETLDLIQQHWPGLITRLEEVGVDAMRDLAADDGLRPYSLIHFATHGQLVTASGLFAHLKFADGDLHYDDITQWRLAGALVVLAACEGAAAEVLPGEEVLSLSRAFLMAGANNVIAGVWQLYDKTAPPLLRLLYTHLAAGHDPPTALVLAQRTWLQQHSGDSESAALFRTPLVWAGLLALGAGTSGYLNRAP